MTDTAQNLVAVPQDPPSRYFDAEEFAKVLAAARNCEAWAFEAIDERYRSEITEAARRSGVEDPEGVANVVLTRVLTRIDSFAGHHPGEFTNFVGTTRVREISRELSKQQKRWREQEVDSCCAISDPPDDLIVGSAWVAETLGHLPEAQREVIELRVLNDLSVAETGQRLGRSGASVRNLQHRAIRTLRTMVVVMIAVVVTGGIWFSLSSRSEKVGVVGKTPVPVPTTVEDSTESGVVIDDAAIPGSLQRLTPDGDPDAAGVNLGDDEQGSALVDGGLGQGTLGAELVEETLAGPDQSTEPSEDSPAPSQVSDESDIVVPGSLPDIATSADNAEPSLEEPSDAESSLAPVEADVPDEGANGDAASTQLPAPTGSDSADAPTADVPTDAASGRVASEEDPNQSEGVSPPAGDVSGSTASLPSADEGGTSAEQGVTSPSESDDAAPGEPTADDIGNGGSGGGDGANGSDAGDNAASVEPESAATPTPEPTVSPESEEPGSPQAVAVSASTSEPTPTPTPTPSPTVQPTPTISSVVLIPEIPLPELPGAASATATPVPTATAFPTAVPTATAFPTAVPTATAFPTAVPTATPFPTAVPTATPFPTSVPTPTPVGPPVISLPGPSNIVVVGQGLTVEVGDGDNPDILVDSTTGELVIGGVDVGQIVPNVIDAVDDLLSGILGPGNSG